jgi:signal transduction histidine kinase
MDSSTDIHSIFDSQLRLLDVSDKGVKAFFPDKTREEQIGKHIAEIVPEVMETGRYEEYLKVIETGEPFQVEETILHPRYATRHISIKAFKVQDGMGMIFSDITERKKAEDELRHYSERLRAMTKQMSGLEESERRHIARELHDNVGQNLTVLGINFSMAKAQMTEAKTEEVQSILDDSQGVVEQTTEAIRDIMANLRPPVLEDYGLLAALRWHGDRFASRTRIAITVQGEEPDPRLGIDVEIVLFRIVQEALTNIAKHASANHVTVKYNAWDGKVHLSITDDGIGFNVADISASHKHPGWGMVTMSERAQSIGGSLCIESRPGGGTQIVVEVV